MASWLIVQVETDGSLWVIDPVFENYLNDRVQRVVVEGSASSYTEIKAGVPQGSILGPLMFLIYINDIVNDLSCILRLFADDTSLYVIVDDQVSASDLVDSDLQTIHNWAQNWLVTFNSQTRGPGALYRAQEYH